MQCDTMRCDGFSKPLARSLASASQADIVPQHPTPHHTTPQQQPKPSATTRREHSTGRSFAHPPTRFGGNIPMNGWMDEWMDECVTLSLSLCMKILFSLSFEHNTRQYNTVPQQNPPARFGGNDGLDTNVPWHARWFFVVHFTSLHFTPSSSLGARPSTTTTTTTTGSSTTRPRKWQL